VVRHSSALYEDIIVTDFSHRRRSDVSQTDTSHAGHGVQEARDGKAGVACYRRNPSDMVLTDILMPEKEGLETIRDLRQVNPQGKLVAMSGAGEGRSGYLNIALRLGARQILNKPFSRDALLAAVTEALVG
jgi:YesN/AraC family two-component response regulator